MRRLLTAVMLLATLPFGAGCTPLTLPRSQAQGTIRVVSVKDALPLHWQIGPYDQWALEAAQVRPDGTEVALQFTDYPGPDDPRELPQTQIGLLTVASGKFQLRVQRNWPPDDPGLVLLGWRGQDLLALQGSSYDGTLAQQLEVRAYGPHGDRPVARMPRPFGTGVDYHTARGWLSADGRYAFLFLSDQGALLRFTLRPDGTGGGEILLQGLPRDRDTGLASIWPAPDGSRAVYQDAYTGETHLFLINLENGRITDLQQATGAEVGRDAVWSADSRRLAFLAGQPGHWRLIYHDFSDDLLTDTLAVVDADGRLLGKLTRPGRVVWTGAWGGNHAFTPEGELLFTEGKRLPAPRAPEETFIVPTGLFLFDPQGGAVQTIYRPDPLNVTGLQGIMLPSGDTVVSWYKGAYGWRTFMIGLKGELPWPDGFLPALTDYGRRVAAGGSGLDRWNLAYSPMLSQTVVLRDGAIIASLNPPHATFHGWRLLRLWDVEDGVAVLEFGDYQPGGRRQSRVDVISLRSQP